MTIVRIKFPDARAARAFADVLGHRAEKGTPEFLGAREARRAADRPGKTAELGYDEVQRAAPLRDQMPPRVRPLIDEAMMEGARIAEIDRARMRPGDAIRARLKAQGLYHDFRDENPAPVAKWGD